MSLQLIHFLLLNLHTELHLLHISDANRGNQTDFFKVSLGNQTSRLCQLIEFRGDAKNVYSHRKLLFYGSRSCIRKERLKPNLKF